MKKVLVFGIAKDIGGIETFFHNYFQHINKNNFHFDFVAPQGSVAFQEDYKAYNSKIIPVSFYSKHPIKYIKEVNKIIKDGNYDIVYVNMLSAANIIPLKLAYKNKVKKIIAHSHNADIPSNKVRKILNHINRRKISKYANTFIACSKKAGDFLFKNSDYIVINNSIDSQKYEFSELLREKIRNDLNIKDDTLLIGHIGRFIEQKNQQFIIELAKKIGTTNNIKFILIGNGEDKKNIIDEINNNNLNNMFIIKENIKDVYKYYNAFDIFILPSKFEGLPVVGIEAQFNGVPCLFSNNITKELGYNSNIKYLDLIVDKWIDGINENNSRINVTENLKKDFDVNYQIDKFTTILAGDVYE